MFEQEGFQHLCSTADLKENSGKRFIVDDVEIAVFKINSEVLALSNICPHLQTRLIYEGFIKNGFVVCPAHGWKFNLRTGKKPSESNGLATYPVKIVDGQIFVKVEPKTFKW